MSRSRLCDEVVKEQGFEKYIGISYIEMEYHTNEAEYLLEVLNPIFEK